MKFAQPHNPLLPSVPDIVFSAIVLAIVLPFFWWFVIPRISKLLSDRSSLIEGKISEAASAHARALETLELRKQQLDEAKSEASQIRQEARDDAQLILQQARETADETAERVMLHAREQIQAEKAAALLSLRSEIATLALAAAGKAVSEKLDDDKKSRELVSASIAKMAEDAG
ncbi:F0F1 ATP synthase subunit B [Tropheryma whipplei]|uniref:ATP synthase subunit b n=2 Tax=Tropheryma whipplei TaxID=2039 RepID=ATPF_TROWT|nr:F0F1 ATP synthase subunit B [Tropheryma whipplei]Q83G87.1 RecName: Full=ATP synthase subunit b; AltName: Full=ATP synthase F(0) sector subunit b; AltName: Full=ATPase subunit I; AltName: Full=F-type ATPase subunit b; Short=F-ATPase subunit b [Tropheryma whipplei str. Twist]Q83HY4.1 RecName: Full=ATP synthase subunit b; AltName: Full=ATP synthase F(0) sector subunit b; AltName: Full=ATPase subunit I; AltName: Full=F-type ATPase subunit b; Short=F-ATPase subunit b [Tropheryma whipplei TW08/27]A